jgi:hypothetical protein
MANKRVDNLVNSQPDGNGSPPTTNPENRPPTTPEVRMSTPPAMESGTSDLFADLTQLRLSQDFAATVGVKKALLTIPIRKPSREVFVRTNPEMRLETAVLELKEDRETYLVAPVLWPELASEATFGPRALFGAITRQGVFFVWPIRLPGSDGKLDDWSRSALEAASLAESRWIRVASNMSLGAYEIFTATADWPEPEWPDLSFNELLRIAFKGRVIDALDHPVLKRLRGEA